jgi:sodium-dependent dicarboxylate transporter 2/3/5
MSLQAAGTLAIIVLMAAWWATEALPFGAVSLVPLVLAPAFGILSITSTAKAYGDANIFLFLGGFCLALALEKCGLHRRIAVTVIGLVGAGPGKILAGVMGATALLSMWVSNTAVALMMLPVGLAVIAAAEACAGEKSEGVRRWSIALLLGMAYAASIGGVATLVGSPPNLIMAGQLKILFPELPEMTFARYMMIALPFALLFLAGAWAFLITFVAGRRHLPKHIVHRDWLKSERQSLGSMNAAEVRTGLVFLLVAAGWIFRADLDFGILRIPGWGNWMGLGRIGDAGVAVFGALLLFILPDGNTAKPDRLLDASWSRRIPWEVLLLFGGGFAIADCVHASGFADIAGSAALAVKDLPLPLLTAILAATATFISEVMSNTAQASIMMPLLGASAPAMQIHPYLLLIPATFASSLAFMMPAGTPPNAIIFASGKIRIGDMIRAGFILNLLAVAAITLYSGVFRLGLFR